MSALYRKKPIPVEARQVPPSSDGKTGLDLAAWCGGSVSGTYAEPKIFVPTLEGELVARVGDWIVKGPHGEFWPVRGDIFAETYEPADTAPDLHSVILTAVQSFQASSKAGVGYHQQLAEHLTQAVTPLVPYREVWDAELPPGGAVCSICGQPVESEPCPDHAPEFFQPGHTYAEPEGSTDVTEGGDRHA